MAVSAVQNWVKVKKSVAGLLPRSLVKLYLEHRWPLYMGWRYRCPLCGGRFRKFVPGGNTEEVVRNLHIVGMEFRENLSCPRCHTIDRERLVYLFLKRKTDLFTSPRRVLHIAPEPRLQEILRRCPNLSYLSVDLENPAAMERMDITEMPLADGSYDAVICSHVLEHIPADRQAMSEIFRVLAPGGWAILQVPVSAELASTLEDPEVKTPEQRLKTYGRAVHVRVYGQDYPDRLESAGFKVMRFNALATFGGDVVREFGLNSQEDVFQCWKPV